jgi:DNA mismatch repair ATPase MutS
MNKRVIITEWDCETAGLDPNNSIYAMAVNINPNFKQYQKYRQKYDFQDLIIFIDNGNEYELFNEDAKIASEILSMALKHNEGYISASIKKDELSNALKTLIRNGYRAAVHEPVKTNKKTTITELYKQ